MNTKTILRQIRKQNKLTQAQVAEYLKLTPVGYGNYETGRTEPNLETLTKLADFYSVSVDYIIGHNLNDGLGYLTDLEKELLKAFRTLKDTSKHVVLGFTINEQRKNYETTNAFEVKQS